MDDKVRRAIVEDLLPLYNDGLLSEETTRWLEEEAKENAEIQQLVSQSQQPLPKVEIESRIDHEKMFKRIHRKLSIYQIIFVAISFFLAINTSILNESFGFILWYTVLGLVTYLFYKDMKTVFLISFPPIFVWSVGNSITEYIHGELIDVTWIQFVFDTGLAAVWMSLIHYAFALIGCVIGLLIRKLRDEDD
ncbi:hypothetical protein ACFQ40_16235 [Kroppenstedtia eburnea]|uniref:hypothetical protein n=1 Tax=Kroppenstedtia eburnea TaxID=714067 RepID=UPI00020C8CFA|nr:hypothetical protein HMPREF9374_2079 [Desmospora sp. 8437]